MDLSIIDVGSIVRRHCQYKIHVGIAIEICYRQSVGIIVGLIDNSSGIGKATAAISEKKNHIPNGLSAYDIRYRIAIEIRHPDAECPSGRGDRSDGNLGKARLENVRPDKGQKTAKNRN